MLAELAGAGMALTQSSAVQSAALWERAQDNTSPRQTHAVKPAAKKSATVVTTKTGDAEVDEALRWERAKDRAAEQQIQKEASTQAAAAAKNKKK
jgi:hypothetical protein